MNTPFLRRRLGRRLRSLRESARLTLDEASAQLDKKRSSLHRVEMGETRADVHLIRSMMDLYNCPDYDLIEQAREALKPQWFRTYGVDDLGYIDVETHASAIFEFCGLNLPGLLQSEAYVRAMFTGSRRKRSKEKVDNDIKVRMIRKDRLRNEDDPLELVAIVDEAALRREVGGPGVMRKQLGHLVDMAELPSVTIQVMPLGGGAHSAMDGAFTLLSFPEPKDPDLLYVEHTAGALHIEDSAKLREARIKFDQLRTEALSPAESVELIGRMAP